ncbi:MAG: right-handed parallel beta-helix repeat-containing protein, partial [Candidatus Bathyarchaeota archaeon]
MKLSLKLLVVLSAIILGTFGLPNNNFLNVAEATYVEGVITEDTTWTLVDSPFILSNNLTVSINATLTVEPGVKVRFGGSFSLIILGKLYADGTDKAIEFTPNRPLLAAGDWKGIEFRGLEQSTLIGCYVTGAINGIFIDNGNVLIQKSNISFCSQNGIYVNDSDSVILNNLISDNGDNGITITGDRPVTIRGNTIISNKNGISLTGIEASNVEISENIISASGQNGIEIKADSHTNLDIIQNELSSNYRGFHIASPTSTYITNNSISCNHFGALYSQGSHTIHFNDVYGNDWGMNVEGSAIVDAEHNYWGHKSGPYHETLNPRGRGDRVGGKGYDLDFVFFLTEPYGHINARPTATLLTDKALVPQSETILFFGTNSFDEGRVDRYFFDFGDGNTSGWTTLSTFTHQYPSTGFYTASLRVMDDFGVTSVNDATITIEVADLPPLHVNMDVSKQVVYEGEQVSVTVNVMNDTMGVENADIRLFSLKGGNLTDTSGYTNSTGYFTTTFTAPDVTYMTEVRIVATASKAGYADGSDYEDIQALPALNVHFASDPYVRTEKTTQVIIGVDSNGQPVDGAAISLSVDYGELSAYVGVTDSDGIFSLYFTAPQTVGFLNVTIMASARKNGYLDGVGQTVLTVEPKILAVQATAEPTTTISEASVNVTVQVEYEMAPIRNADVTITTGNYSITELTDLGGEAKITFVAPPVNTPSNITLFIEAGKD